MGDDISLIKIDVEGAEKEVTEGFDQTIIRFRPAIIFEVHPTIFDSSSNKEHLCKDDQDGVADIFKLRKERTAFIQKIFEEKNYVFYKMRQNVRYITENPHWQSL